MKQVISLEEALELNVEFETDIFLDQMEEMYNLLLNTKNTYKAILQYYDLGWKHYVFRPINKKLC